MCVLVGQLALRILSADAGHSVVGYSKMAHALLADIDGRPKVRVESCFPFAITLFSSLVHANSRCDGLSVMPFSSAIASCRDSCGLHCALCRSCLVV